MIGKTISHYKITEKLGEGGMGVVYKAEDTKLKRAVALKFLPPELTRDPVAKERFIHEAQAAAVLDNPNICTVYEIEEAEGQSFISMAYIEGQNLKERVESGPLKLEEALDIAMQVAEGLQAAHEKEIVHRDIKSANIMVTTKGQAKIMDFGLAKLAGRTKITKTGTTLGTVAYMSPEQAKGGEVDQRTDIWSLGVVLYEMVTGKLPFKSEYDQAVVYSILNEEPEPVTSLRPGVPKELEWFIAKALAKSPGERYQQIGDILVDLRSLKEKLISEASREQPAITEAVPSIAVLPFREGISVQDQNVQFQRAKDSLRVMLAQISPAYDPCLFAEEGLVKVKNPERQARKILKVIEHALSSGTDLLLFPELTAPFSRLRKFEEALSRADKDLVANICYEHTLLRDLISILSEREIEEHGLSATNIETKLVNFCRIWIKAGPHLRVFTQIKLTPFSSEFSLLAKDTLVCGKILHRFVTNWGNFLFLICKDYVGEVRVEGRIPMFDFLKSLTSEGLHYVFVSALNPEPEAFIHAARVFYYLQEKSNNTFSLFLNAAELNHTTVVFPVRPHPKIRTAGEVEIIPLFQGKPGWGTQLRFPGCRESIISGTFVRLDKYKPMPTKEMFSPVYQTDLLDLTELGIEPEVFALEEKATVKTPRPTHNLPPQTTPFLGRKEELEEIAGLLENPSCRLLTLVGPGGIGKTRLALQAASEKIGEFAHGVYFVPLAPIVSPDLLISTVASSLEFSFQGREDPKAQLLNYLREKEMLLVMDNFEHLLEGAELLAEILENAPKVKTLITSRERLNLRGEWISEVQGMTFPQSEETDKAESYSAVQLFLQSAQRIHPQFELSDEEKPFVIRICQLVEGMPLGIELASAWLRVLSCKEVVQEIEHNIDFLSTSLRDVPERHKSMRVVFVHSWDLLSDKEREAFMKMSVFRGGFRREAAQRVTGASLFILSALVDKSLLRWSPTERYEMHELLRQYAEEKLSEVVQGKEEVQDLHCGYYAELLHQKEEFLKKEKEKQVLDEIGEEIENVRKGWSWAVEERKGDALGKFLESLFRFYLIRGWFQEGEEVFGKVAEKSAGSGAIGEEAGAGMDEILGRALARQGVFCLILSDYSKARELLQKSLIMLHKLDVRREIAFSVRNLGFVAYQLGEYVEARRHLEESLAICREINDSDGRAISVNTLGLVAYNLGEFKEARELHRQSLTIGREMGDRQGMAKYLLNLGNVAQRLGDYEEARQLYEESLSICREIGDRWGMASSLNNLGVVAKALGEHQEAQKLYEKSLMIKRDVGDRKGIATSLGNLGDVAYELGEYQEATELQQEKLAICKEIGNRRGTASSLSSLGRAKSALEQVSESKRCFCEALKGAMEIHAAPVAVDALVGIANLLRKKGEMEKALELLAFAIQEPSASKDTKERAERLRSQFICELPPQTVGTIQKRGKGRKLEEIAEEILGDEKGLRKLFGNPGFLT